MKLNQLRDVIAIANRGSLRAAARDLALSQPALTRSVHELERELGAPLFERRARGMRLTPVGETFVRRATAILSEVRRAHEEAAQIQGGTSGKVVAGLSLVAHVAMLPKALPVFRKRYPQVQLHIVAGPFPALETKLSDGSIDFYVGPEYEHSPSSELVQEKLFDNTRVIVGRIGHPSKNARSLSDLVEAEWATTSVTLKADEELGDFFKQYKLPAPRLVLQSESALTLAVALANSDLLAMLPQQWTEFPPFAGYLSTIRVKETFRAPSIVAVHRRELPLTPAAEFLLDLLRRNVPRPRRPTPGPNPSPKVSGVQLSRTRSIATTR
jgi:LysR family transcriptional regulator, regulator of abg operon